MVALVCVSNGAKAQMARKDLRQSDIDGIADIPLFRFVPQAKLLSIIDGAQIIRSMSDEVLFTQGENAAYLYVLLEGQVGLTGIDQGGEETVVEIVKPGGVFIEAAVLMDLPLLMSARVLEPSRLLLLPAERVRQELLQTPELAMAMLASVSSHFRIMVREIKELKLKSAGQRLGSYLLSLTEKTEGGVIFRLPHSKGLIAARVGIRRETLSRLFSTLRDHGVVVDRNMVSIIDVAALAAYCRQPLDPSQRG